jgi:alpha-amylase
MTLRGTILQPWNWHSPKLDNNGNNLYQRLQKDAGQIKNIGFTAVWLPPVSEGVGGDQDVGYGIKNWYQLNQTKYGDQAELQLTCQVLNAHGIQVYHDQVHNHLMGGDFEHGVWCLHVKCDNKNEPLDASRVWFQADIPTNYPWLALNQSHFDAFHPNDRDCWALSGKRFDREAKRDPLMGCDLDFDSIDLTKKLEAFGLWFKSRVCTDGYRFDAAKHIRPKGTLGYLTAMRYSEGKNMFAVAEYFDSNVDELHRYIASTYGQISLFDFPLQRKLVEASRSANYFNMSTLHTRTLTREQPVLSAPFVHSHDDQPPMHGGGHRGEYVGD